MPTQRSIATHLDLSQSEVRRLFAELKLSKDATLAEVRVAYIRKIRATASGMQAADGTNLIKVRARNETLDAELKELALAEKRGLLVSLRDLEPELRGMIGAFKVELLGMPDKLRAEIEVLHGICIDAALVEEHVKGAFRQLARYDPERKGFAAPAGRADGAGAGDVDDRVGPDVSEDVVKG